MPYRSDYDPFAEFEREQESEDGYEPYAEFRGEPRRQRSADALNFHERARRYGRPVVLSNGAGVAYWMDRDAEAADRCVAHEAPARPSSGLGTGPNGHMPFMAAVERLSGRKVETVPTPGRRVQRSTIPPYDYQWVPSDLSRPILPLGEQERAFSALMEASSG